MEKNMKKPLALLFALFLPLTMFSCASGNSIVTGTQREATNPESVAVYAEFPEKYEVIGIVSASSDATGISSVDTNYAVKELKKQAAKIGANGLVIQSLSSSSGGFVSGNMWISSPTQNVSGTAIYVPENGIQD